MNALTLATDSERDARAQRQVVLQDLTRRPLATMTAITGSVLAAPAIGSVGSETLNSEPRTGFVLRLWLTLRRQL